MQKYACIISMDINLAPSIQFNRFCENSTSKSLMLEILQIL